MSLKKGKFLERKFLAYLKPTDDNYPKIMVHETQNGVYTYYFVSSEDNHGSYDSWSELPLEEVMQDWQNEVDERGWIEINHFNPKRHDEICEE